MSFLGLEITRSAAKNLDCLVRLLKLPIIQTRMSAKKGNIRSYFSPASRRPRDGGSSSSQEEDSAKASKRAKSENDEKKDGDSSAVKEPLSPQHKQMIEEKRQQALEKLHGKNDVAYMGDTWKTALQSEFSKDYFVKLRKFVESERKTKAIYPPEKDVFAWTQLCPIDDVKVVILGQDPYHGPNQAHGLCFSVRVGVPAPPSLVNIYKELKTDIDGFEIPNHGYLVGWARQGVLLLNAVLTVVAHNANSHKDKGWELFTDAVIKWINRNLDGVVFLLWGSYAQKKGASIDKKRHCVIKGPHPSPLSAHRGFFGCKHFSQANKYLEDHGKRPIDWTSLPKED